MNNKFTLILGDSMEKLKELPDNSIDCCVTSPPYYGLRDYGTGEWVGGDKNCNHDSAKLSTRFEREMTDKSAKQKTNIGSDVKKYKKICPDCGAIFIDKQIGIEETPEEYIEKLVCIFREVKRLLKEDGTLWINIGDSYAMNASGGTKKQGNEEFDKNRPSRENTKFPKRSIPDGIKQKDLIGIPWMLAFALRDDGWYLRQDIIWQKLNPMPESVTDRFTKSHEYIFLLSKNNKYYFDINATMERAITYKNKTKFSSLFGETDLEEKKEYKLKHKRDVWDICVNSNSVDHYATYPTEIVETCILSGCKSGGVVIDPFNGTGTTGIVANELGRDYIGIELSKKYFGLTKERFDSIENNCKFIGITDE